MTGNEIRARFLEFFRKKGHTIKPSASLVPDDPTVLFSIAGMVQFKKMFLGEVSLEFTRAATSQKCVRTNDIENVGKTARHHTFFEMLGNFSFGDYFKKEAISWSLEFLTKDIGLDKDKLYVTIYKNDDESFEIWNKDMNLSSDRIFRMGEDTNFWTMGDTGPCGPCSEIIYDLGPEFGCGKPGCTVGCDCDRYLELWNLVFTQFDRLGDGKLIPLPKKNIDTGMGLERLTRVVQKVNNNFETDLIFPLIDILCKNFGIKYKSSQQKDLSLKNIADHIRAITFLINDGVIPSNEERGYVLRKLIRRSVVHGKLLGYSKSFLHILADTVIEMMKSNYTELAERQTYIKKTILLEEENFISTLERAHDAFEKIVEQNKKSGNKIISGEDAFVLSDTYGLPISITETLAAGYNLKIDIENYEKLLETQQNRSREDWHKKASAQSDFLIEANFPETNFVGYTSLNTKTKILYLAENNLQTKEIAKENIPITVILSQTPFYAESGGQIGDTGTIINGKENKILIENAIKYGSYFLHTGRLVQGKFQVGDSVDAVINDERRKNIARNHTATHLLQAMLRKVLGNHVNQAGSLVTSDYLRFDFTHFSILNKRELERIEELVNEYIFQNLSVETFEKSLDEAKKEGAMALFGEKYGDRVRMVKAGEISKELCGGTHVKNTGEIGIFKILKEESIGSGIRRIEAITAQKVLSYFKHQESMINEVCEICSATPEILKNKILKLQDTIKILENENTKFKNNLAGDKLQDIINNTQEIKDIKIASGILPETNVKNLRDTIDQLKNKFPKGVFILGCIEKGKPVMLVGITKNLISQLSADKIVKEIASILEGNGGGRPDLAQLGGTKPEKLESAIQHAIKLVKVKIA